VIDALPRREREVFETLCRLETSTAAGVRGALSDPLSDSAVRTMLSRLEAKGLVERTSGAEGFLYRPCRRPRRWPPAPCGGDRHLLRRLGGQRGLGPAGHGPAPDTRRGRRSRTDDRRLGGAQAMSWSLLIALLIKSSVVAGAGLTLARFLGRFLALGPRERVDILRATVCLLLALPVIMALLPALTWRCCRLCRRTSGSCLRGRRPGPRRARYGLVVAAFGRDDRRGLAVRRRAGCRAADAGPAHPDPLDPRR
jgi:hypothetical protein